MTAVVCITYVMIAPNAVPLVLDRHCLAETAAEKTVPLWYFVIGVFLWLF